MYRANTCKWQTFTSHLLYKLAKSHIMPGTKFYPAGCNTSRNSDKYILELPDEVYYRYNESYFAIIIRCSRLRLSVRYFIYFKFTPVFF